MELHLEAVDPEEKFEDKYPILYFKGFSRGSYSPEAVVSGSVRLLEDGCIRWSFVSIFLTTNAHTRSTDAGFQDYEI